MKKRYVTERTDPGSGVLIYQLAFGQGDLGLRYCFFLAFSGRHGRRCSFLGPTGCCRKLREQDLQGSGGTARGWAWDVGSTTGPAGFGPFQIAAVPVLSGFSLAVGVG